MTFQIRFGNAVDEILFAKLFLLLLISSYSFFAGELFAHEFRPGHLQLIEVDEQDTHYQIIWKKPILLNTNVELTPVFPEFCQVTDEVPPKVGNVAIIYRWRTNCDLGSSTIQVAGLNYSHTDVLISVEKLKGDRARYVLRPDSPALDKEDGAPAMSYFTIGIEHLVFGIDHVLSVIGLFLFIGSPLIKPITAFTVTSITPLSVLELKT